MDVMIGRVHCGEVGDDVTYNSVTRNAALALSLQKLGGLDEQLITSMK